MCVRFCVFKLLIRFDVLFDNCIFAAQLNQAARHRNVYYDTIGGDPYGEMKFLLSHLYLMHDIHRGDLKDGDYFCYCAYVMRISRYSGFLYVLPINTGIFLPGLKLCGKSRT